jgi:hypothetical protein
MKFQLGQDLIDIVRGKKKKQLDEWTSINGQWTGKIK